MGSVNAIERPRRPGPAEVAMQFGHRIGLHVGVQPGSLHEVEARVDRLHKRLDVAEVVGEIAVTHDHDLAPDVRDRGDICRADTEPRDVDDASAVGLGDRRRIVGR
jgi:hypothetical protein